MMVRSIVLGILSYLVLAFGQSKEGTGNIQKAEYLGRWVGYPTDFLKSLGYIILPLGADARFCVYGDFNVADFINQANDCLDKFTSRNETLSVFCAEKGFSHYGIANLRISHSNVIVNTVTYNKYGHFMVIYGDLFCAMKTK